MNERILQLAEAADRRLSPDAPRRGTIITLCGDISAAVQRLLNPEAAYIFRSADVAAANQHLDGVVIKDQVWEYGPETTALITHLRSILEESVRDFKKMVDEMEYSPDDFSYVFDVDLHPVGSANTLLLDMEAWFEKMITAMPHATKEMPFSYVKKFQYLARQSGGDELISDFNTREQEYRSLVEEENGLRISEVLSYAKLLRDDFNNLLSQLARKKPVLEEQALKAFLAVYYFNLVEMHTNPLIRSVGVIREEREEPGCFGTEYDKRLLTYLDMFRRITVAVGAVKRSLQLIQLGTSL